jgi:hypothetical protein
MQPSHHSGRHDGEEQTECAIKFDVYIWNGSIHACAIHTLRSAQKTTAAAASAAAVVIYREQQQQQLPQHSCSASSTAAATNSGGSIQTDPRQPASENITTRLLGLV